MKEIVGCKRIIGYEKSDYDYFYCEFCEYDKESEECEKFLKKHKSRKVYKE